MASAPRRTDDEIRALRQRCTRALSGHKRIETPEYYRRLAAFCEKTGAEPDNYGDGTFLKGFEAKIAALLGLEAAVFMPSGTMAQQIAVRIWAENSTTAHFGMHPTSHLELHEQRGYAALHGLRASLLGPARAPIAAADLEALAEPCATVVIEMPMREIGGVLPTWDELAALKTAAAEKKIPLHLDGARLWETQPFYGRSYAEIVAGFSSVYVSFYKGIGALAGALLAGPSNFIQAARVWQRRHGGNLVQMHPLAASAAMQFDERVAAMPQYTERARQIAALIHDGERVAVTPSPPHVNMFHACFKAPREALAEARLRVAEETGIWLLNNTSPSAVPGWTSTEIYFGDAALQLTDTEIKDAFSRLFELAR